MYIIATEFGKVGKIALHEFYFKTKEDAIKYLYKTYVDKNKMTIEKRRFNGINRRRNC